MTITVELAAASVRFTGRAEGDLGRTFGEPSASALANRAALIAGLHLSGIAVTHQVHGVEVAAVPAPLRGYVVSQQQADAQVTALTGTGVAVHVADCLPIAIAGVGGVAMVHAGWRGLAGGIVANAVDVLRAGGVDGAIEAAIGPGAGACCFEVGPDVLEAFRAYDANDGRLLDLAAIARAQLQAAGVASIQSVDLCTICAGGERFFSHRREGEGAGRQAGVAWLR
jgi:YfiH family protein